jgi:hypothetical protein
MSFALYGFPEFMRRVSPDAMPAKNITGCLYGSMLNNQPYQPVTLIKDAQRHGPFGSSHRRGCSDFNCTENSTDGLQCVWGSLYKITAQRNSAANYGPRISSPFASIEDLKERVPEIQRMNCGRLQMGALNFITEHSRVHRRTALWQRAPPFRPLLKFRNENPALYHLFPMNLVERIG